jgi:ribosomal protein S18 acetylase RimI-like enzyme
MQGLDEELRTLPGSYARPLGRIWLAWAGDSAIGCVALRPREPGTGEVKRLYVAPRARGQQVARALVARLVITAATMGYRRLRLDTLPSMRAAQRLYRDIGFREIRPYYESPFPGTKYFELSLSARGHRGAGKPRGRRPTSS